MQPAADALARSLRRNRLARDLSLSELARQSGVSKGTLSKLERGLGNPSVDTVWALAQALNVPFGELFDTIGENVIQVRRIADAQLVTEVQGFMGRRLLSRHGRGGLELYVLDIEAGAERMSAAHSPGVIEHVIAVTGTIEVGPEGQLEALEPGDCISFSADLPHHYRALGGPARLLSLTDYP